MDWVLETGHICSTLQFIWWNILTVYTSLSQHYKCQGKVSSVTVFKHTGYSIFYTLTTGLSTMLDHWDELLLMDEKIKPAIILQSFLPACEFMHNAKQHGKKKQL